MEIAAEMATNSRIGRAGEVISACCQSCGNSSSERPADSPKRESGAKEERGRDGGKTEGGMLSFRRWRSRMQILTVRQCQGSAEPRGE